MQKLARTVFVDMQRKRTSREKETNGEKKKAGDSDQCYQDHLVGPRALTTLRRGMKEKREEQVKEGSNSIFE